MGQVIFIGFFALAAMGLAFLGYVTGRYDAYEEMEEEDEQEEAEKESEAALTTRIRRFTRKHKRIDYNLRELWR